MLYGIPAVTNLLAVPLANLIGFTATGIAKWSLAAKIQSIVYGAFIPKGCLFSALQSFTASSTYDPTGTMLIMAGCGLAGYAVYYYCYKYKPNK